MSLFYAVKLHFFLISEIRQNMVFHAIPLGRVSLWSRNMILRFEQSTIAPCRTPIYEKDFNLALIIYHQGANHGLCKNVSRGPVVNAQARSYKLLGE